MDLPVGFFLAMSWLAKGKRRKRYTSFAEGLLSCDKILPLPLVWVTITHHLYISIFQGHFFNAL
jgi:hypothetical protein